MTSLKVRVNLGCAVTALKVHGAALSIVAACVGFIYLWARHPEIMLGVLGVLVAAYLYRSLAKNVREWLSDRGFISCLSGWHTQTLRATRC
jgi:hypothetical protein